MPDYKSKTSTHGRNMAGARALWRATGMKDNDFGKPIIAIANSFTQFVPGHVHLKDLGQMVAREIEKSGGKCLPIKCDIRMEDQLKQAVETTVNEFGGIDFCINNARPHNR